MSACVFVTTHEECNTSTSPGGFKEKKGNPLPDQGHVDNFVIYNESSAAPRSKTYTVMTPAGTHTRLHTCLQPAVVHTADTIMAGSAARAHRECGDV